MDWSVVVLLGLGIAALVLGASQLGSAGTGVLQGLWPGAGRNDWPHGVQEGDAPAFEVSHLDSLPGAPVVIASWPNGDPAGPRTELVDLAISTVHRPGAS